VTTLPANSSPARQTALQCCTVYLQPTCYAARSTCSPPAVLHGLPAAHLLCCTVYLQPTCCAILALPLALLSSSWSGPSNAAMIGSTVSLLLSATAAGPLLFGITCSPQQ
jgi:hypothetical protein